MILRDIFNCQLILLVNQVVRIDGLNPVLLIPGDGGTQLKAKLTNKPVPHWYCKKTTEDYMRVWVSLSKLFFTVDCTSETLRLVYDNKTRTTKNPPGVDIKVDGWGDTSTVEYLDPDSHLLTPYFAPIVKELLSLGYKRNVSVRGVPYDFRKAPNEMGDLYMRLKDLIEDTYQRNNNSRIVCIAHSMGNPVMLYFLNHQSQQWKDKYIRSFIGLGGVWGGVIKSLRLLVSGDHLAAIFVRAIKLRTMERSMVSTSWLIPSDRFWKEDEVLIVQPKRNYTVKDYKQLYADLGFMNGYDMRKDTENLIYNLTAPGVEFHSLHGVGLNTPGKLVYTSKTWPNSPPVTVPDQGDGTVNLRSLLGFLKWKTEQKQAVYHQAFQGVSHMDILKNENTLSYIKKVLQSP